MSQTISGTFRDIDRGYADYYIYSNKNDSLAIQINNQKPGSSSGITFANVRRSNPNETAVASVSLAGNEEMYIDAPNNITFRANGGGNNRGRLYVWDNSKVSDKANVKLELLGSLKLRPQTGSVNTDDGTIYVDVDGNLYAFSGGKKHTLTGLDQLKKDLDVKLVAVVVLVLVLSGACVYMCKK